MATQVAAAANQASCPSASRSTGTQLPHWTPHPSVSPSDCSVAARSPAIASCTSARLTPAHRQATPRRAAGAGASFLDTANELMRLWESGAAAPRTASGGVVGERIELRVLARDALAEGAEHLVRFGGERRRVLADRRDLPLVVVGPEGIRQAAHLVHELLRHGLGGAIDLHQARIQRLVFHGEMEIELACERGQRGAQRLRILVRFQLLVELADHVQHFAMLLAELVGESHTCLLLVPELETNCN